MGDNPRRKELENLRRLVSGKIDDLKEALDKPQTIMAEGDAWTGSVADVFGEDVDYRKTDLRTAAETLTDDIDEAVSAEPKTLPDGGE
ncbi:hypothetical protein CLV30_103332 [Haloactinopolyspora alba]|uniref:Uncharacterized protein n=1 Tax=Haloactinopolyspora alba TaxID=648780 RepID=A0A2P8E9R6_9ACTN|nr:hypothetical protein [Haloactinopolyspora alba]PSL06177.1 hypothetical protein CLV30_103332 [Haloactinopolyspora alba]